MSKGKTRDTAWFAGKVAVDLQDATEKLIDIALIRLYDRDLIKEINAVVEDLDRLKNVIWNAISKAGFDAADAEAKRNAENRKTEVSKTRLEKAIAELRDDRLKAGKRPDAAWKAALVSKLGMKHLKHYKTLGMKLPDLGMTEADIVRMLQQK